MTEADKKDPDMEVLKQAFALFDRDRDGEINQEELAKVSNNEKHQARNGMKAINTVFIHFCFLLISARRFLVINSLVHTKSMASLNQNIQISGLNIIIIHRLCGLTGLIQQMKS